MATCLLQENRREAHSHLTALLMIIQADLSEQQQQRFSLSLVMQNVTLQALSTEMIRSRFMVLFCVPAAALEAPMYKYTSSARSYCILDQGELEGEYGCWVEDDEMSH